jgi:hypothetical protein
LNASGSVSTCPPLPRMTGVHASRSTSRPAGGGARLCAGPGRGPTWSRRVGCEAMSASNSSKDRLCRSRRFSFGALMFPAGLAPKSPSPTNHVRKLRTMARRFRRVAEDAFDQWRSGRPAPLPHPAEARGFGASGRRARPERAQERIQGQCPPNAVSHRLADSACEVGKRQDVALHAFRAVRHFSALCPHGPTLRASPPAHARTRSGGSPSPILQAIGGRSRGSASAHSPPTSLPREKLGTSRKRR